MKHKILNQFEQKIILNKGTEAPFSGKYYQCSEKGTYSCKQCGNNLFDSRAKFDSGTGWPSFDDEIIGSIEQKLEDDGRVEIICKKCKGHLGHIFKGENITVKNTRYCVNSASLDFNKG